MPVTRPLARRRSGGQPLGMRKPQVPIRHLRLERELPGHSISRGMAQSWRMAPRSLS